MSNVIQLFPNAEVKQVERFLSDEERMIAEELSAEDEFVDYLLWSLSADDSELVGKEDPISIFRAKTVKSEVA